MTSHFSSRRGGGLPASGRTPPPSSLEAFSESLARNRDPSQRAAEEERAAAAAAPPPPPPQRTPVDFIVGNLLRTGEWTMAHDAVSGRPYYYNVWSRDVTWDLAELARGARDAEMSASGVTGDDSCGSTHSSFPGGKSSTTGSPNGNSKASTKPADGGKGGLGGCISGKATAVRRAELDNTVSSADGGPLESPRGLFAERPLSPGRSRPTSPTTTPRCRSPSTVSIVAPPSVFAETSPLTPIQRAPAAAATTTTTVYEPVSPVAPTTTAAAAAAPAATRKRALSDAAGTHRNVSSSFAPPKAAAPVGGGAATTDAIGSTSHSATFARSSTTTTAGGAARRGSVTSPQTARGAPSASFGSTAAPSTARGTRPTMVSYESASFSPQPSYTPSAAGSDAPLTSPRGGVTPAGPPKSWKDTREEREAELARKREALAQERLAAKQRRDAARDAVKTTARKHRDSVVTLASDTVVPMTAREREEHQAQPALPSSLTPRPVRRSSIQPTAGTAALRSPPGPQPVTKEHGLTSPTSPPVMNRTAAYEGGLAAAAATGTGQSAALQRAGSPSTETRTAAELRGAAPFASSVPLEARLVDSPSSHSTASTATPPPGRYAEARGPASHLRPPDHSVLDESSEDHGLRAGTPLARATTSAQLDSLVAGGHQRVPSGSQTARALTAAERRELDSRSPSL